MCVDPHPCKSEPRHFSLWVYLTSLFLIGLGAYMHKYTFFHCAFQSSTVFSVHVCHDVCTCACVHTPVRGCVSVCVSNTDETDSDLIQLKTNTLFCLQTLSWKQAGFPGYQREGQIQATDREREMSVDKRNKKGQEIKD